MDLRKQAKRLRASQTEAEQRLWYYLRAHRFMGLKFKRQKPLGRYIVDFVCHERRLVVEVDGGQHAEQTDHEETLIYNYTGKDLTAQAIASELGLPSSAIIASETGDGEADIEVLLGADSAPGG